jgi:uncharacterized protein (DUF1501 family)
MKNINRRDFLAGGAALTAGLLGLPRLGRAATATRNLIIVWAGGGWDTCYALDPKPGLATVDVPAGGVQSFGNLDIFTDASRPNVTTFFQAYAPISAVIRGVNVRSIAHPSCSKRILTGSLSDGAPDLGAMAAFELGKDLPVPYLVLGDTAFTGPLASISGRVGNTNQVKALLSPVDAYSAPLGAGYSQPTFSPDTGDETAIRAYVEARAQREYAVRGSKGYNKARIDDFLSSLGRGDQLKPYDANLGARGNTLQLLQQLGLAATVIQNGVSFAVMVDARLSLDTHTNNAAQGTLQDSLYLSLKSLADDLASRPGKNAGSTMLDETAVVVMSEMSRTPKLNANQGKDHWPVTSALVFGAGVNGGRAYGGTDDDVQGLAVNMATGAPDANGVQIQSENVVAGALAMVGGDADAYLPTVTPMGGFHG